MLTTLNAKYIHKNLALRWLYSANLKHIPCILKEYVIAQDLDKIAMELLDEEADVIAFSCYIWNIEPTRRIIQKLRQKSDVHIVVGGPEVSYGSEYLLEEGIDAIMIGEGEIAFWAYIDSLIEAKPKSIIGVYTKQFPNTVQARVDLAFNETLPTPYFPDYDAADMGKRYLYVETSRGCPYSCTYCLSSTDQHVRLYSEEYILDVLEKIAQSEVKIVKLLDRTFNVMPQRALRIARYMNEYCVNQVFEFEVVAETLSTELLKFFIEEADKSRFRLEIGVQSFHQPSLKAVGRRQDNDKIVSIIRMLQQAGVIIHVDLIAGLPYEDMSEFQRSFNRLFDLHCAELQLGILKTLKGTKLNEEKDKYHLEFNENPPYDVVKTAWVNQEDLRRLNQCAYAVERYYNNGRCRTSIITLLDYLDIDAFTFFMALGERLNLLKRPYSIEQAFLVLKETALMFSEDEANIVAIINCDYYRLHKQRPKKLSTFTLEQDLRKAFIQQAARQGIANKDTLYHYACFDTIYDHHTLGLQCILYTQKQDYPKRWLIHEGEWEEII